MINSDATVAEPSISADGLAEKGGKIKNIFLYIYREREGRVTRTLAKELWGGGVTPTFSSFAVLGRNRNDDAYHWGSSETVSVRGVPIRPS